MAKKTLYQTLQVNSGATPEVIRAAYEARLAALKDSHAPEVVAERALLRDALDVLCDPVRRKLYDEKMREEALRAMSSGGEAVRLRPANAAPASAPEGLSSLARMTGIALLATVAIVGGWVWLDHKHKVEAQRIEAERQAEESRRRDEALETQRDTINWAKDRSDAAREAAEQRRQEYQRQVDNRRIEYDRQRALQQQQAEERRAQLERQRADYQRQREDQENARRSQQQLERDRRYLQELERNRGMAIPGR